jgi:TetR/AcrR family transcriptional regulator, transcriptional repressor for nem operon
LHQLGDRSNIAMADNTRDKLIDVSVQLIAIKGFNNTGIAEILGQAAVPKGSFYHYFKSKDDLGLAVIEHYGLSLRDGLDTALNTSQGGALTRLRAYFDGVLSYVSIENSRCNCLLGNLGQELALQSDGMRQAIYKHYQAIENRMAQCLAQAKIEGELYSSADEYLLARTLFAAWEGCLVRAKLEGSTKPLQDLLDLYFDKLLKP